MKRRLISFVTTRDIEWWPNCILRSEGDLKLQTKLSTQTHIQCTPSIVHSHQYYTIVYVHVYCLYIQLIEILSLFYSQMVNVCNTRMLYQQTLIYWLYRLNWNLYQKPPPRYTPITNILPSSVKCSSHFSSLWWWFFYYVHGYEVSSRHVIDYKLHTKPHSLNVSFCCDKTVA